MSADKEGAQTIGEAGPNRLPFSEHLTKITMQISNHYPEYEKKVAEREGRTVESKSMEELRKENAEIKKAFERSSTNFTPV